MPSFTPSQPRCDVATQLIAQLATQLALALWMKSRLSVIICHWMLQFSSAWRHFMEQASAHTDCSKNSELCLYLRDLGWSYSI